MGLSVKDLLNAPQSSGINWNWRDDYVQADVSAATSGDYISAPSTLILGGPPKLVGTSHLVKIGMSPSMSFNQHIPQQRVAEIGSRRVHIINGTPQGAGTIARFLYNDKTLLSMVYGKIFDKNGNIDKEILKTMTKGELDAKAAASSWESVGSSSNQIRELNKTTEFQISLWDSRVNFPVGFAIHHRTSSDKLVGAYYLEGVKFTTHNMSKQADQLVLAESLSFSFDRLLPIAITA